MNVRIKAERRRIRRAAPGWERACAMAVVACARVDRDVRRYETACSECGDINGRTYRYFDGMTDLLEYETARGRADGYQRVLSRRLGIYARHWAELGIEEARAWIDDMDMDHPDKLWEGIKGGVQTWCVRAIAANKEDVGGDVPIL